MHPKIRGQLRKGNNMANGQGKKIKNGGSQGGNGNGSGPRPR